MSREPISAWPYPAIWVLDFEFRHPNGHPLPEHIRCMVARDLKSGQVIRLWEDEFPALPPFDIENDLFVAFAADAEWSCFLKLGWPFPVNVIDLRYEYLALRNASLRSRVDRRASLQDALRHFGLPLVASKSEMRDLAMADRPSDSYSPGERTALIEYCDDDVRALAQVMPLMALGMRLDEAVWRGRFSCASARIEANGIPLDVELARWISSNRERIRRRAISEIDDVGLYLCHRATMEAERRARGQVVRRPHTCTEACELWFNTDAFLGWLEGLGLELARYRGTGNPILNRKQLEEYQDIYPEVAPSVSLRNALSDLHSNKLVIGPDGRNRSWLAPFGSITGRCQPSNSEFVFGLSRFYRNLIQAPPGHAVIYLDLAQEEFLIAAVRSQDDAMFRAYMHGDSYIGIGTAWGVIKPGMNEEQVASARKLVKAAVLGIQYQMGARLLAKYIKCPKWQAEKFILLHKDVFWKFWKWSDDFVNSAQLNCTAVSGANWDLINHREREPTLRNFPIQSAGGEILRQICCMAVEAGIELCAPIHDAVLICCPLREVEQASDRMKQIMIKATCVVLGDGQPLRVGDLTGDIRVDAAVYPHPLHLNEGRDSAVWKLITRLREEDGYESVR